MALCFSTSYAVHAVKASNRVVLGGAHVKTICHTNSWIIDSTPPVVAITGGLLHEESRLFDLDYTAMDNGSFIRSLRIGIGASAHDTSVRPWELICREPTEGPGCADSDKSSATVASRMQLTIPATDRPVFVRIASINNAKLLTREPKYFRLVADETPPLPGTVFNSKHTNVNNRWMSGYAVSISWDGFNDPESSIAGYEVCLGTSPGLCDASVRTVQGLHGFFSADLMVKEGLHSQKLYATVVARNGAFKPQFVNASGSAFTIDLTSPKAGAVTVVNSVNEQINVVGESHLVRVSWHGFADAESLVVNYEVAVGSNDDAEEYLPFHPVGCERSDDACLVNVYETHGLTLPHKARAKVTIRATNGAGQTVLNQSSFFTGEK